MTSHREEALKAINQVWEMLTSPTPMDGLQRHLAQATLKYATEEVLAIQELKRVRKAKGEGGA